MNLRFKKSRTNERLCGFYAIILFFHYFKTHQNLCRPKFSKQTLKVPLLLIHGDGDTAIPLAKAREAAALVPGARLEVLEGLGHLAHEEAPERVVGMIVDFAEGTGA